MRALVTGASGFIGQHLVAALASGGWQICVVDRSADRTDRSTPVAPPQFERVYSTLELNATDLTDIDCIFHLAGLAHDNAQHASADAMRQINVDATLALFAAASAAHVRRFVYLSSIKVLGERSAVPLAPNAALQPQGAYALSKAQAEQGLNEAAISGNVQSLVIVRPPLVYGPGVKANFLALIRWAASGWPLPVGGATASRAWVSVDNLVDLLIRAGVSDLSGAQILHAADAEQSSVRDLLRQMRRILGQPERLVSVSHKVAVRLLRLAGRQDLADKIFAPMQVDFSNTTRQLGWSPPYSQNDELQKVLTWYRT